MLSSVIAVSDHIISYSVDRNFLYLCALSVRDFSRDVGIILVYDQDGNGIRAQAVYLIIEK